MMIYLMKIMKMMNTIIKQSVLVILFSSLLIYSQEKTALDSSKSFNGFLPDEIYEFKFNDAFLFNRLNGFKLNENFLYDSSIVWMRTKYLLGNFNEGSFYSENYPEQITSPLLAKYYESQKYAPIKMVLQSVQIGAVGYLAYLHLKKYGFLKKK